MHRIRMKHPECCRTDSDTDDTKGTVRAYASILSFRLDKKVSPDEIKVSYRKQKGGTV